MLVLSLLQTNVYLARPDMHQTVYLFCRYIFVGEKERNVSVVMFGDTMQFRRGK